MPLRRCGCLSRRGVVLVDVVVGRNIISKTKTKFNFETTLAFLPAGVQRVRTSSMPMTSIRQDSTFFVRNDFDFRDDDAARTMMMMFCDTTTQTLVKQLIQGRTRPSLPLVKSNVWLVVRAKLK